jgi:hypothetical protein
MVGGAGAASVCVVVMERVNGLRKDRESRPPQPREITYGKGIEFFSSRAYDMHRYQMRQSKTNPAAPGTETSTQ